MDLTGQLSNLSTAVERLLAYTSPRPSDPVMRDDPSRVPIFRARVYEQIRDALVLELAEEEYGLRLREIRRRVEARLGRPVDADRFKDYVNGQSKAANPLVERLGYGMYRLRP